MARSQVARKLVALGGSPEYREGVVTDNGNVILDVYHFAIMNPVEMEKELNNVPGVVTNGILLYAQQILLLSARLKVPKSLNNKRKANMTTKVSLDKSKIKFLLLEGVHQTALEVLQNAGYTNIEYHKKP